MTIGLPALAGAAAFPPALAAFAGGPAARPVFDAFDARVDRALRDLAGFYNQIAGRGPTPADVRAVAPQLRALVSYRQTSGRDGELAAAMRGLISQEGRQRLTRAEPDLTPIRQGLQYYGMQAVPLTLGPVDRGARSLALDVLEREGAAGFYLDAWAIIDMFVTASQTPTFCDFVQEMMRVMEAMASMFCVAAVFLPIFGPECFASSVVLAILKFLGFVNWC